MTNAALTDDENVALLARWRNGSNQAGDLFYLHNAKLIKRYFRVRITSTSDVADLVQETFARCLHVAFRGEGSVRSFLYGIAHFVFMEYLRRKQRHVADEATDTLLSHAVAEFEADDPEYVLGQKEDQKLLMRAMRRIRMNYQIVLEMSQWGGLTQQEIAAILECPAPTVGRWKSEAFAALEAKVTELAQSQQTLNSTTMTLNAWRMGVKDKAKDLTEQRARGRKG